MAITGDGDFPLRSAWLGRNRGGRRNSGALPRKVVNIAAANSANMAVWSDYAFAASGPSTQTLTPALFTNTPIFLASTVSPGAVDLAPALFSNTPIFFASTVNAEAVNLAPALFTNTQTFYNFTINVPGATQTLTASLFTNNISFFAASINNVEPKPETSGSVVKRRKKFRPAILLPLAEKPIILPDLDAQTVLAGLSAEFALGSVSAKSPDPIDFRTKLYFTEIETYVRGLNCESSFNDPTDEELLFILDFALG